MKQHRVADLEERIANAFADGAKSDIFEDLIRDVETAAKAATAASAAARTKALDPVLRAAEAASARRESDDATFRSDRLQAATVRLRDRHRAVAAKEEDARRRIEYERVMLERDKLAEELKQKYPEIVTRLVELLTRIDGCNREIVHINSKLPDGGSRVLEPELVARNLKGFLLGTAAVSIIEGTKLPNFVSDVHVPYLWPQSERMRTEATIMQIRA